MATGLDMEECISTVWVFWSQQIMPSASTACWNQRAQVGVADLPHFAVVLLYLWEEKLPLSRNLGIPLADKNTLWLWYSCCMEWGETAHGATIQTWEVVCFLWSGVLIASAEKEELRYDDCWPCNLSNSPIHNIFALLYYLMDIIFCSDTEVFLLNL